jgi:uncharacterized protein YvpB
MGESDDQNDHSHNGSRSNSPSGNSSNNNSNNSSNPVNYPVNDPLNNVVPNPIPPIVTYTLNETIDISGASIHNEQGVAADGSEVTHTTFTTTNSHLDVQITENLAEVVESRGNHRSSESASRIPDPLPPPLASEDSNSLLFFIIRFLDEKLL